MAAKTVGIGYQNFEQLIQADCFYIDKTDFIREWWENRDVVTLIARPRRFGKTLNMSMLEYFFSIEHAGKGSLFENFSICRRNPLTEVISTVSCREPILSSAFPSPI